MSKMNGFFGQRSPLEHHRPLLPGDAHCLVECVACTRRVDPSLEIILTIVLYGIGTDYILFLLFRYRERLRAGDDRRAALVLRFYEDLPVDEVADILDDARKELRELVQDQVKDISKGARRTRRKMGM